MRRLALLCALALGGGACPAASQEADRLSLPHAPADTVRLRGGDARTQEKAQKELQVYAVAPAASEASRTQVLGRYELRQDALVFTPFFPFMAGQRYRVEVTIAGASPFVTSFLLPAHAARVPRVIRIAPTAHKVPANALRFYVYFSQSMRGRFDRRSLRLTDEGGREVSGAFMDFGQELWSANGCRLTLLFDPGRIKRGVTANQTEGPPLLPGRAYTLSAVLPGATPTSATFLASGPLRRPLDPKTWRLTPPAAGTRAPLTLQFDRVMDRALLEDAVTIRSANGQRLSGTVASAEGERKWLFTPAAPWTRSLYRVVFSVDLEDVSGNRIGEALDHEAGAGPPRHATFAIPFRCKSDSQKVKMNRRTTQWQPTRKSL